PPPPPAFPYTTLFRSGPRQADRRASVGPGRPAATDPLRLLPAPPARGLDGGAEVGGGSVVRGDEGLGRRRQLHPVFGEHLPRDPDRKSTRLNSSHSQI